MSLVSQSASPPRGHARGPWEPKAALSWTPHTWEATPPLCHVSFLSLSQGGLPPSYPPGDIHGGVAVMSHPSMCLAAGPATQTPVSRVSPEPCPLHPLHVVSVWAGAGGRAWLHLGGRLGPGVGTGPQAQGTIRWGEWLRGGGSHPRLSRGPAESVPAAPRVLRMGKSGPESGGLLKVGHGDSQTKAQEGRLPWRRLAPQLLNPNPTPQDHVRASPSA